MFDELHHELATQYPGFPILCPVDCLCEFSLSIVDHWVPLQKVFEQFLGVRVLQSVLREK